MRKSVAIKKPRQLYFQQKIGTLIERVRSLQQKRRLMEDGQKRGKDV